MGYGRLTKMFSPTRLGLQLQPLVRNLQGSEQATRSLSPTNRLRTGLSIKSSSSLESNGFLKQGRRTMQVLSVSLSDSIRVASRACTL